MAYLRFGGLKVTPQIGFCNVLEKSGVLDSEMTIKPQLYYLEA